MGRGDRGGGYTSAWGIDWHYDGPAGIRYSGSRFLQRRGPGPAAIGGDKGVDARKCEIGLETERNYKEERKRGEDGRRDRGRDV